VAKNNRHNAAFVVGSVLGAVVGAGAALWKTPYTGQELREKLTGGPQEASGTDTVVARPADSAVSATSMSTTSARANQPSIKDKVLSSVEKTLAPIVGVELGKTASGSDAKVVKDPNIKVNRGVSEGATGEASAAPDGTIGLSRDRVNASEWAAAYSGDTSATTQSQPAQTSGTTTPSGEADTAQGGDQLLRHPHRWRGYEGGTTDDSSAGSTQQEGTIGLSRDRVDADKWAAAYSGDAVVSDEPSASTDSSQNTQTQAAAAPAATNDFSSTLVGQSRDQRNAARWAAAYGTTAGASTDSGDSARESTEQTGRGADPAFRGDDGDAERHAPVERGMPENVAPATNEDSSTRDGREFAADAASTDQLTTPQVQRVPDAVVEHSNQGMHPFPKLGGKE
jgi:gas vesicle protein